jgi:hypothetical protein
MNYNPTRVKNVGNFSMECLDASQENYRNLKRDKHKSFTRGWTSCLYTSKTCMEECIP